MAALDLPVTSDAAGYRVPREDAWPLFLRFLRFGALAWGGPVAQIAMIRQELVEQERWIDAAQFNRVLAVYQVLPGPEAHELCVYFGMRARGTLGGIVAGLGFMLPGFVLMFALSWAYVHYGLQMQGFSAVFAAVQAAVAAVVVRAVARIGSHVLLDGWRIGIAAGALLAQLAGVHFALTLGGAGVLYLLAGWRWRRATAAGAAVAALSGIVWFVATQGRLGGLDALTATGVVAGPHNAVSVLSLFWSGLQAGLLTFGGAYTVIPFLQRDAVSNGAWMDNGQFLDGLALSGLLPAPLVIFATFVGYLGGGPLGAVAMTAGVFLPAFAFTLIGHDAMERAVERPLVHRFLDGVTAGVIGLIAGTAIALMQASLNGVVAWSLFAVVLVVLFFTKARLAVPVVILAAAVCGGIVN